MSRIMNHAMGIAISTIAVFIMAAGFSQAYAQNADYDVEFVFEEGMYAFEEGAWYSALTSFQEVIEREPDNVQAHHYLGLTLLNMGHLDEAVKELEKVRDLDPSTRDINLDLGTVYQKQGQLDKAEASYREEISRNPDNGPAHFALGYLLFSREKYGESIPLFDECAKLDKEMAPAARYYKAVALYKLDRKDEAMRIFENLVATKPSPDITEASRRYLDSSKGAAPRPVKNWGVTLSALYQYDTNVVAASEDAEFPLFIEDEEISDKEDSRGVLTLTAFYRVSRARPWIVEGRYAFYQSFHAEIDMFNLQYHSPGATLGRAQKIRGKDTVVAVDYRFAAAYLGNDLEWFSMNHYITPYFRVSWNENFATTVGYIYNIEDFHSAQPDRDNTANSGFARADWVFWPDRASLSLSAGMDFEEGDIDAYDVRRPWTRLMIGAQLPFDFRSSLTFIYEDEDHYNDDIQNRRDEAYSIEFLVLRKIWGPVEGLMGVSYKENNSNVDSLTYDRTIVGGGLVARF